MEYKNLTYYERTALHEASHALVAELSSRLPGVREVVARAVEGGGYCQLEPTEPALEAAAGDREARRELLEQGMRIALAGPVGEILAFGEVSDATLKPSAGRDQTDLETAADLSLQILRCPPKTGPFDVQVLWQSKPGGQDEESVHGGADHRDPEGG